MQVVLNFKQEIRSAAFAEAARIAEREGNRLMRIAQQAHDQNNYDAYEALESEATVASRIAERIRRAAKRKPK